MSLHIGYPGGKSKKSVKAKYKQYKAKRDYHRCKSDLYQLQGRFVATHNAGSVLKERVQLLSGEVTGKSVELEKKSAELEEKRSKIKELNDEITVLEKAFQSLILESEAAKREIREEVKDLKTKNEEIMADLKEMEKYCLGKAVCIGCMDNPARWVIKCGHRICCDLCASDFLERDISNCPFCRTRVDLFRTFIQIK